MEVFRQVPIASLFVDFEFCRERIKVARVGPSKIECGNARAWAQPMSFPSSP